MAIPDFLVEKLGHDLIAQIKPADLVATLAHLVEQKLAALKEDKDHDGVVDGAEALALVEQIASDVQKLAKLISLE